MNMINAVMVPHPPIIIPEVGHGQEKLIQDTINNYNKAARFVIEKQPDTIVIISPHSIMYSDYFHISPGTSAKGSLAQFNANEVKFEIYYDTEFVSELCSAADETGFSAGIHGEKEKNLDHGTMVPLYFIRQAYGGEIKAKIIRIGLSGLSYSDHYKFGMLIRKTAEKLNRKITVVASGDLSHRLKSDGPYGYKAEGPVYDDKIMNVMEHGAFGELLEFEESFCDNAGECGQRSFVILAGCFDGEKVKAEKLSYEGPFGVGYGICTFTAIGQDTECCFLDKYLTDQNMRLLNLKQNEDEFVRLARKALEEYVLNRQKIEIPDGLPDYMITKQAGTFVSLKKHGQLRGCIGTISATTGCIAEEIINNAISACSRDTRFNAVTSEELNELVYSVDILGETEDIDTQDDLDVKRYGVIVTCGNKRGLLLPNLDGVDTVEQQIAISKKKAGIRDNEKVKLQRFEVIRHF